MADGLGLCPLKAVGSAFRSCARGRMGDEVVHGQLHACVDALRNNGGEETGPRAHPELGNVFQLGETYSMLALGSPPYSRPVLRENSAGAGQSPVLSIAVTCFVEGAFAHLAPPVPSDEVVLQVAGSLVVQVSATDRHLMGVEIATKWLYGHTDGGYALSTCRSTGRATAAT